MKKEKNRMQRFCQVVILILCAVQFTYAQDVAITHGPFIQHLTANSVVINWSSSVDCISWVEYYEEDGSYFYQKERIKVYNATGGLKNIGKQQSVTIEGLTPQTKYAYRVYSQAITKEGDMGKVAATRVYKKEPLYFTTAAPKKSRTSCVVLSDMHENGPKVGKLLENVEWNKTDFVIMDGDFVNNATGEEAIYSVLDTMVDIFAQEKPLYMVRGNHETRGAVAHKLDSYFHFPNNQYYYTFSSGNTFFIVLDSGEDKPDSDIEYSGMADFDAYRSKQAQWLTEVVASEVFKKAERKVVFMHIPPYNKKQGREWHGELEVRKKFMPILNKAAIDLMVCGHTHSYALVPEATGRNNFPILIVDHESRVDLTIDSSGIRAKRIGMDSELLSEVFFEDK
ncbi:FN3 domain-containing metallophosphoesterase family protein [Maribacter thermophilus]|uniref:FN3 domain-containing metallophosphoesterase family protein n=1 Tax=Maribacter thermophilus TaxID=1197874 RepID=UPI00069C6A48|nr:FN3 domain-containing metallophosphoesterase family protein [Maribacter thermophilus]